MYILINIITSLGITMAILLLVRGIRYIRSPGYQAQLASFGDTQHTLKQQTRYSRWIRPVALRLADTITVLRGFSEPDKMTRQLNYAGNIHGITAHELYGLQLLCMLSGLLVSLLFFLLGLPFRVVLLVLLTPGGFFGPQLWLHMQIKRRQNAITLALPDLLDMLAVCMSAGQGFEKALQLLAQRGEGPLYEELRRVLNEQSVGESHTGAFRRLAERNSSEALRRFVAALLQAETLGTSIATTLEQQAEDMRIFRRHRARAKGAQAATKISLVVVVAIMPSVMCLMLGAVGLSFWESLGSLFHR
jgi:tight adherence protein C